MDRTSEVTFKGLTLKTADFPRIREAPKFLREAVLEFKGWLKRDYVSIPAKAKFQDGLEQSEDVRWLYVNIYDGAIR